MTRISSKVPRPRALEYRPNLIEAWRLLLDALDESPDAVEVSQVSHNHVLYCRNWLLLCRGATLVRQVVSHEDGTGLFDTLLSAGELVRPDVADMPCQYHHRALDAAEIIEIDPQWMEEAIQRLPGVESLLSHIEEFRHRIALSKRAASQGQAPDSRVLAALNWVIEESDMRLGHHETIVPIDLELLADMTECSKRHLQRCTARWRQNGDFRPDMARRGIALSPAFIEELFLGH